MNRWVKTAGIILLFVLAVFLPAAGKDAGETSQNEQLAVNSKPAEEGETEEGSSRELTEAEPEPKKDENYSRAKELLQDMTLQEKAAQMFLVCCRKDELAEAASQYDVGGILLFSSTFQDKDKAAVLNFTAELQENADIPLIMAVDEEGGTVVRISKYSSLRNTPFLSPRELFLEGGYDRIREDTREKCELLNSLGINVNMAPVCDVSSNSSDFIYERAFGGTAEETAEYIELVVTEMKEKRTGSVLKHFPGYGDNGDTHKGIMYDDRDRAVFDTSDFLPFQAGIAGGADAVLVSHTIVACMDSQYPASLSEEVHRILREDLSFDGVILTDDLDMQAITDYTDGRSAAVQAVLAGNDMLCCGDYENQIAAVVDAVKEGTIDESRIDESVIRILMWKIELGLIN